MERATLRSIVLNNLVWFAASLALAFIVWLIAVVQADPVGQVVISERVPIQVTPDAGLIIINEGELPDSASITVRGPQSVISDMTADDIALVVDLTGYTPGTYNIPLNALVAPDKRASIVRITPRQWSIRLEPRLTQLKPVRVEIVGEPAAVYAMTEPSIALLQTEVTGSESRVSRVVEVVARLSLADQRTDYDGEVALIPIDAEGEAVAGVVLAQSSARVQVGIQQRNDVAEVRVQPNIVGELPSGYVLTADFDYAPQTVTVRGARAVLDALPGTIFTEPIDLSDQTASFEVTVPIALPDPRLLVLTGGSITVRVGIAAQQVSRQFDRVPLTLIGETVGMDYTLTPDEVTVLVTGPQSVVDALTADVLGALVDVTGLAVGTTAQIAPLPSIGQGGEGLTVSLLPARVDVAVTAAP